LAIPAVAQQATTAPTPPITDSSNRIATTAYVNNLITGGSGVPSFGLTGYVYCNGGGVACSAATTIPYTVITSGYPVANLGGLGTGVATALAITANTTGGFATYPVATTGVTSVTITVPSFLTATGCVITTSGTCALGLATETANYGFWGPASGAAAAPTFRAQVCADVPTGTWCKISSTTVSSQASFQDTTDFAGNLAEYEIVVEGFIGSTVTAICELQVYSASSYQTSSYIVDVYWHPSGGAFGNANPTTYVECGNASGQTVIPPYTYRSLHVRSPSTAAIRGFTLFGYDYKSGNTYTVTGSGLWTGGTTAITGFQIIPSTGSTFSATVTIYGRK
jgi:hypothetical protein